MRYTVFAFVFSCLMVGNLYAQETGIPVVGAEITSDSIVPFAVDSLKRAKQVDQRDLVDLARKLFRLKPGVSKSDSSIVKPNYSAVIAVGYTLTTRLGVTLSGNCAFRTVAGSKLSTVIASAAYTQNKQFTIPIQSSIWTRHNKYNLVGDFRFFKYPQSTYGLGSNTSPATENAMDYLYFRVYEVVLREVFQHFYGGAGYIIDRRWEISETGPRDASLSDYSLYGKASTTVSSGFTLNGLFDSRDNGINPTKGFYTSVEYRHNGKRLGSTSQWQSVLVDVRKYLRFPAQSRNVWAVWWYNWWVLDGKPPYLDLPSTAWDAAYNTGEGYIQGRFRGYRMAYAETQYRFGITRNGLLGGVLFLNVQSFSSQPGTPFERLRPGFGPGLRIKLNKVSNTNIAIDYGFGTQGSHGLFINIGEAF